MQQHDRVRHKTLDAIGVISLPKQGDRWAVVWYTNGSYAAGEYPESELEFIGRERPRFGRATWPRQPRLGF